VHLVGFHYKNTACGTLHEDAVRSIVAGDNFVIKTLLCNTP